MSVLALLLASSALARPARPAGGLTPQQELARDLFRELVEIKTTRDVGCTRAAEAMAARLRAAGFADSDLRLVGPAPQHLNLVVRLRGRASLRPILFFGHLDVVEALRRDWSFDPFEFREQDGYFYGRGTSDMKCEDADIVANLIRLKREGFVPGRDVIVALTEDEEGGDANGVDWLLANRRDLVDAELAINLEGGGGDLKAGRPVAMEVMTSEKIYVSYRLEVRNPGGHSSLPVRENAIYRLAAGLGRLSGHQFPVRLDETTRTFFERSAGPESGQVRSDMLAVAGTPTDTAAAERLAASSAYYNAMMRTTCVPTMISGGHAENALPQTAQAVVNCRLLPDDSAENVLATLRGVLADSQITVTQLGSAEPGPSSPLRRDVMDRVERLTAAMWPGVPVTPVMVTGATDARRLRRAGIPAYGVSGIFADIDDVRAHGRDERIGVREFYDGVEFLYEFIKSVTR